MLHVLWYFVNGLCLSTFKFVLFCFPVEFIFLYFLQKTLSITPNYQIPWLGYQYDKKSELDMVVCCNYYSSGFGWQKEDWFSNMLSIYNFSDLCVLQLVSLVPLRLTNWRYSKMKFTSNSDLRNLLCSPLAIQQAI